MHPDGVSRTIASQLADGELLDSIQRLVGGERACTVELIEHLAELETRRLYLGQGFSSLFTYCRDVLHLSEHEAYHRIEAARAARRFPILLDLLGDGRLNLTTLRLIAPHITPDTLPGLLAGASHRSKREVEELVVRYAPMPEPPPCIRRLPAPRPASASFSAAPLARPTVYPPVVPAPPPRPAFVSPVAPHRYHISFTANEATRDKLRLAQDLLRHAIPTGDTAQIVDRALTALIEDLERKKIAATERPRPATATAAGSRHVPAAVRRAVWRRDGYRCAFVGPAGRCTARGFLELHHLKPYGAGGEATVDNIELRCRAHNQYESDLFYAPRRDDTGNDTVNEPRASYARPPSSSRFPAGNTVSPPPPAPTPPR